LQELTSLNATIETRERETKDALERTKRELERVSSRLKDVETSHKQQ
jgi:response regulator RpfG family c-di-GMP phosphodiesterase